MDALGRLAGVRSVTVRLQAGIVAVETDPAQRLVPARLWREIERVGFAPAGMEVWVAGRIAGDDLVVEGGRWPVRGGVPPGAGAERAHVRVVDGGADPPVVEPVE